MIRPAERRDIAELVALCQEHAAYEKASYTSAGQPERLARHLFDAPPSLQCLVLELSSAIVGYATFMKQFATWEADYYLYLDCLYLKESARGKGWGAKMMKCIEELAQAQHIRTVQWQTPTSNQVGIAFYRKLGAQSRSKERFFWSV